MTDKSDTGEKTTEYGKKPDTYIDPRELQNTGEEKENLNYMEVRHPKSDEVFANPQETSEESKEKKEYYKFRNDESIPEDQRKTDLNAKLKATSTIDEKDEFTEKNSQAEYKEIKDDAEKSAQKTENFESKSTNSKTKAVEFSKLGKMIEEYKPKLEEGIENAYKGYLQKGGESLLDQIKKEKDPFGIDSTVKFHYFDESTIDRLLRDGESVKGDKILKFIKRCYEIEIIYLHAIISQAWFSYINVKDQHTTVQKKKHLFNLLYMIGLYTPSGAPVPKPDQPEPKPEPGDEEEIKIPKSVLDDLFKRSGEADNLYVQVENIKSRQSQAGGDNAFNLSRQNIKEAATQVNDKLNTLVHIRTLDPELDDSKYKKLFNSIKKVLSSYLPEGGSDISPDPTIEKKMWKAFVDYYVENYVSQSYQDDIKQIFKDRQLTAKENGWGKSNNSDEKPYHFIDQDNKPGLKKIKEISSKYVPGNKEQSTDYLNKEQVEAFLLKCREMEIDIYDTYKNIIDILNSIANERLTQNNVDHVYFEIISKYYDINGPSTPTKDIKTTPSLTKKSPNQNIYALLADSILNKDPSQQVNITLGIKEKTTLEEVLKYLKGDGRTSSQSRVSDSDEIYKFNITDATPPGLYFFGSIEAREKLINNLINNSNRKTLTKISDEEKVRILDGLKDDYTSKYLIDSKDFVSGTSGLKSSPVSLQVTQSENNV